MVLKKITAAAIVALTVITAVGTTAFAAERAVTADLKEYNVTAAVGASGFTEDVKKEVDGMAQAGVLSGIPDGEHVNLTVMDEYGYIASDFCYYDVYAMEREIIYPINYHGSNVAGGNYKLRVSYPRYYTYNPQQITVKVKWMP